MTASFHIGRVAGVDVRVHWSVLIIFGLIAWSLSAGQFPAAYPGNPAWAYLVAGHVAAIVFFLGLLAHELSHAVLAMRNGLSVEAITLWMFGGVAELHGEARTPGAELRIAGVGPLVSLLLGVGFGAVAGGLLLTGVTGLVFGAFAWLAGINLLLAVFNVLPAAPLDGGRLLRAGLWRLRGDRTWAAVAAARAGLALGGAMILLGLWLLLGFGAFGGLWLALIGWFLMSAAAREEQQARVGGSLRGVRVRDVMTPNPQTAPADIDVAEFVERHLLTSHHSAFPLTEDGQPVGLVTLSRVRQLPADQRSATRVQDIACRTHELPFAGPDENLTDLLPRLSRCAEGRALVVGEGGELIGIVSPSDISRAVQRAALTERPAARM